MENTDRNGAFKTISRCSLILVKNVPAKFGDGLTSDDDEWQAANRLKMAKENPNRFYCRTLRVEHVRYIWPTTPFSSLKQNVSETLISIAHRLSRCRKKIGKLAWTRRAIVWPR